MFGLLRPAKERVDFLLAENARLTKVAWCSLWLQGFRLGMLQILWVIWGNIGIMENKMELL